MKKRSEIETSDKWDVEALYTSFDDWKKEFTKLAGESEKNWPEFTKWQGKLHESAEVVKKTFSAFFSIHRILVKLYVYAHLRQDEDLADEAAKSAFSRISMLLNDFGKAASWIEPEILQLSEKQLSEYGASNELAEYANHFQKIVRQKPHTLSESEEALLALTTQPLSVSGRAFSLLNDADLKFGEIADSQGKMHPLSHGTYGLYLQSEDRLLRENAFNTIHQTFLGHENTITELLSGQVQKHLFTKEARKYESCLEAALFPHQIDPSVYHTLIDTVDKNLSPLHDYVAFRKEKLQVENLYFYDLYVPLIEDCPFSFSFEEAVELTIDSVAILGSEYQEILRKGLTTQRWVDRYENLQKRSGAYSSGCYDSHPYILMNFHGILREVMTLTHEAGHSMQSYLSNKYQPYQDADYPIFVAEVASTFHEELLFRHLLKKLTKKEERAFLINQKMDDIRATLIRQAMFAEFELMIHDFAEKKVPLTPALLKKEYLELNQKYYGPALTVHNELSAEFLRIPHFYYNFYVYQYATGISASYALVEKVEKEGDSARDKYLEFLSAGGSKFPLELLSRAGVDMQNSEPVELLFGYFHKLFEEFKEISC